MRMNLRIWKDGTMSYGKAIVYIVTIALLFAAGSLRGAVEFDETEKQRVIVLTDISNEPDDEESMVRFLVYSNEFDVEGLIATTSVWLRDKVRPERIKERVEAYGRVRPNLLKHASGYPTEEHLLRVIRTGRSEFGMEGVGEGKASEGSRHIIDVWIFSSRNHIKPKVYRILNI